MTKEFAMKVLLDGVCGINVHQVVREAKVDRRAIYKFLNGEKISTENLDKLSLFIWKKINSHLLITESDLDGYTSQLSD